MRFLLTTNPGIEDIVVGEIKRNFKARVFPKFMRFPGRVLVETSKKNLEKIFGLRSIYHIIQYVSEFEIETDERGLQTIYKMMKKLDIPELEDANTFRVTAERKGIHEFTSIQAQSMAGKALAETYHKRVDLKKFDVNVFMDIIGKKCYVGLLLTREPLSKRFDRPFNHPAAIKPPLAYAMLELANIRVGETLLDPFCGGGTIPIEAALVHDRKVRICGSDINEGFLNGARENAKAAGVLDFIEFKKVDARKLHEEYSEIDKIVTNPPYGVRSLREKPKTLKFILRSFLDSAMKILTERGRMVVMQLRASSFRRMIYRTRGYIIIEERVVESGGLFPHVFVMERIQ